MDTDGGGTTDSDAGQKEAEGSRVESPPPPRLPAKRRGRPPRANRPAGRSPPAEKKPKRPRPDEILRGEVNVTSSYPTARSVALSLRRQREWLEHAPVAISQVSLAGKEFVLSGALTSMTHAEAEKLIRRHGGRVKYCCTERTSFFVVGKNPGVIKCDEAAMAGIPFLDEEAFFQLLSAANAQRANDTDWLQGLTSKLGTERTFNGASWAQTHQPRELTEMRGNDSAVKRLGFWLETWRSWHLQDGPRSIRRAKETNRLKRAALLSGLPGSGKTLAISLLAKKLGMTPVEWNLQHARGKDNPVKTFCQNLYFADSKSLSRRRILVIDGLEDLTSQDRGCLENLSNAIESAKIPIVCTTINPQDPRLLSVAGCCAPMEFRRCHKTPFVKPLRETCRKAGLVISGAALERFMTRCHCDLRALLNGLQVTFTMDKKIHICDLSAEEDMFVQRLRASTPSMALHDLLSVKDLDWKKWNDLYDQMTFSLDVQPMLLHENYIHYVPRSAACPRDTLDSAARAAKYMSFGEQICQTILSEEKWDLASSAMDMSVFAPSALMRALPSSYYRHAATEERNLAYVDSLTARISSHSRYSVEREAVILDYMPALKALMTAPLIQKKHDAVQQASALMQAYRLDWKHFTHVLNAAQFEGPGSSRTYPLLKSRWQEMHQLKKEIALWHKKSPHLPAAPGRARDEENFVEESLVTHPDTGVIQDDDWGEEEDDAVEKEDPKAKLARIRASLEQIQRAKMPKGNDTVDGGTSSVRLPSPSCVIQSESEDRPEVAERSEDFTMSDPEKLD